jgi:hypothetical protein
MWPGFEEGWFTGSWFILFYFIFNDNQLVIYPLKGEKIKPAQA